MKKSERELAIAKKRQKQCESAYNEFYCRTQAWGKYLVSIGKFFKNRLSRFIRHCDCPRCIGGVKNKKADLNFKEQKRDFERNE